MFAIGSALAQRSDQGQARGGRGNEGQQRGLWADLDAQLGLLRDERGHAVGKTHRLAHMAAPVTRLRDLARQGEPATEVGDEPQPRWREPDAGQRSFEAIEHRLDERRVKRVRHLEPLAADASALEGLAQDVDGFGRAGDHRLRRCVDRRDRDPRVRGEQRRHDVGRCVHRGHRTALGKCAHAPAAFADQMRSIVERHHASDAGRRDLADRMPDHDRRCHTPGAPGFSERELDREEGRLGELGAVEQNGVTAEQQLEQRPADSRIDHLRAAVECGTKHRHAVVQATRHACVLRALACEDEGDAGRVAPLHMRDAQARRLCALGQCDEALPQLAEAGGADRRAVFELRAAGIRGEAGVGQRDRR